MNTRIRKVKEKYLSMLNCPFCGRQPTVIKKDEFNYSVKCYCGIETNTGINEMAAKRIWNRRRDLGGIQTRRKTKVS